MEKLFGTDGIRGLANKYPMTAEMAERVGRAVASIFRDGEDRPKIVIGRDTRESGEMLESAIVSGVRSVAGEPYLTGVLPTPGVAFIASSMKANAGIVISASHNPYHDNGIKVFGGDGYKLSDTQEAEIENRVLADSKRALDQNAAEPGRVRNVENAPANYIAFLKGALQTEKPLDGLKVVLDCSNGATCRVAPQLFLELGADVEALAVHPNGKNINHRCGSEHPQDLIKKVTEKKATVGLAFDGDGDRLIAVDETGNILSGDHILAICAWAMKQNKTLKNSIVVSTVMSNMGLGVALKKMGIRHATSQVGDRYVMQKMIAAGAVLGGEDSGHMIFSDYHTTGDGILTALKLIEAMQMENKPLSELSAMMPVYPQVLINVDVQTKPDIKTVPAIMEIIQSVESEMGNKGRVLVRYSGTQPLCRVMVEGPSKADTRRYCRKIADIIKANVGLE
ncbi:MAG: phosphoglucosamine mutase [Desulfobacterales bacterium]|nr:phosphoglucosamine mutase [Desulfobacterales bacterium]